MRLPASTVILAAFLLVFSLEFCSDRTPAEPKVETPVDTLPLVFKLSNAKYKLLLDSLKGNVVLVNVYAIWCTPCMQEMPNLVKLQHTYDSLGLQVVLLSMDDTSKINPKIRLAIDRRGVDFPSYVMEPGDWGDFKSIIDESWRNAIPFTVVYSRNGERALAWTGSESYEEIEKRVLAVL